MVEAKFKKQIGDYYRLVTKCKEIEKQLELRNVKNGLFKNIGRWLTAEVDVLTGIYCRVPETPIDRFIDDYDVSTFEVSNNNILLDTVKIRNPSRLVTINPFRRNYFSPVTTRINPDP